jgi:hypothetical protein
VRARKFNFVRTSRSLRYPWWCCGGVPEEPLSFFGGFSVLNARIRTSTRCSLRTMFPVGSRKPFAPAASVLRLEQTSTSWQLSAPGGADPTAGQCVGLKARLAEAPSRRCGRMAKPCASSQSLRSCLSGSLRPLRVLIGPPRASRMSLQVQHCRTGHSPLIL